jgi:hypothetical protein
MDKKLLVQLLLLKKGIQKENNIKFDNLNKELLSKLNSIQLKKGDKGDSYSITDKDYAEIASLVTLPDVKDGNDYVLTQEDKETIASLVELPIVADGKDYILTDEDKDHIASLVPISEIPEFAEKTIEEIRDSLEDLTDEERLDVLKLKNLDKLELDASQIKNLQNNSSKGLSGMTRYAVEQLVKESGGGTGGAVDSVNSQTGVVVLDTDNIVEGINKYVSAGQKTKLNGIEDNADVTDTANVTSAGALMNSEVTNLAQVKAFNSGNYATAAQGSLADSALQSIADDSITLAKMAGTGTRDATTFYRGDGTFATLAGGGASTPIFIKLTTTSTADANPSTEIKISWDTLEIDEKNNAITHSISTNNSRITLDEAGYYRGFVNIGFESIVLRTAPRVRIKINNTTYLTEEARHTYIRATGGHNQTTANFTFTFEASATDYIEVTSVQDAVAGIANIAGASLTLEKL